MAIYSFDVYRTFARRTRANYAKPIHQRIQHWTIGLTGEAGEVANVVKKHVCTERKSDAETVDRVRDEAGDVLWYLDALLDEYGLTLAEVAEHNVRKLSERYNIAKSEFCLPAGAAA